MSYYHKYLKYKNKYVSLKNMSGGGYDELKKRLENINREMHNIDEEIVKLRIIENNKDYIKSDFQLEEQKVTLSNKRKELQEERHTIEGKIKNLPMKISVIDVKQSMKSPYFTFLLEDPFDELPKSTLWIVEAINKIDNTQYIMILKIKKPDKDPEYSIKIIYNNEDGKFSITPIVDMKPHESIDSINKWLPAFTKALEQFIHPAMTPIIQRLFPIN